MNSSKLNSKLNLTLPRSGEPVWVTPFSVNEMKVMSIVEKQNSYIDNIELVNDIITRYSNKNPEDLCMIDFQWLFVQICRASCGSIVDLKLRCSHCESEINSKISLDEVMTPPEIDSKLKIDKLTTLKLRAPKLRVPYSNTINMVRDVVHSIEHRKKEYLLENESDSEVLTLIDSFSMEQLTAIRKWLNDNSTCRLDKHWQCPMCYRTNRITLEGLTNLIQLVLLSFDLGSYFKTSFIIANDFGISITELENMKPYEYRIYVNEVMNRIKEREKLAK